MNEGSSAAIRATLGGFEPSEEQWNSITHAPVPLAVIAGAGSGKTAVMAARIVWMIEQDIARPSQVLGLTFTNRAAGELEERVAGALEKMDPQPPESPAIFTYNAFSDSLVRAYGVRIGIEPEVGLLSEAQRWQLLMGAFDDLPPFDAIDTRSLATVLRKALGLADACSNHLVSPERIIEEDERVVANADDFHADIVRASAQRIELARVVSAYTKAKAAARRIDFGDQVTMAVEILERFEDVARELRERFPVLLLDEYQDTNVAQRRMLQVLAPGGSNVTAVGDARQNIYQWRGSTLFNLIDFPKSHFLREGGASHEYGSLSKNYRSGSRILDVANALIEPVPEPRRPGKPVRPHEPNGEGAVTTRILTDQYAEAAYVAEEILDLVAKPVSDGRTPADWRDFAILVRRKSHIQPLYTALRERDIPVEVVGLGGLLQTPEILDTVSWLRVISDPGPRHNRWLARLLMGPRFRVHYRDLAVVARWAAERNRALADEMAERVLAESPDELDTTRSEPDEVAWSLAEALDHTAEMEGLAPEAARRLDSARRLLRKLRSKASAPLLELVSDVIDGSGIRDAVEASPREDAQSRRANLSAFLGSVASFAPVAGEPSLHAFLAYLDAAEDVEETLDPAVVAESDSVKLMTVHQAKGLEFEVVFVPCVAARRNKEGEYVNSIFPDTRTTDPQTSYRELPIGVREDAHHLPSQWQVGKTGERVRKKKDVFHRELIERAIEDERRLFYVAITRAKQRLYVTCAWWYERQGQERGPSSFFEEVARCPGVFVTDPDQMPETNPLMELLREAAIWPPLKPHSLYFDDLFPEGFPATVEALIHERLDWERLVEAVPEAERETATTLLEEHRETARMLSRPAEPPPSRGLGSLSATQAAGLASGSVSPETLARPLPERPTAARRIGTEVHQWIEELARGLVGLADEEEMESPSVHLEPSRVGKLRSTFKELGYPDRRFVELDTGERMAEVPFVLKAGSRLIRGRIDAVYYTEEGGIEVVDFKTGKEIERPRVDQLAVYGAALRQLGIWKAGALRLTYVYLATGKEDAVSLSLEEADDVLATLASLPS